MYQTILFLIVALISLRITTTSFISVPPEANYNFTQYISNLSYPYEQHLIQTKDGYILTYFRIQKQFSQIQDGLPVVFIQHGLLDSADSFIINDENQAIALILANQGFDVWLGNNRGNKYGLGHINYNSGDPDSNFWNFSWQEMSEYDLPAGMEYIGAHTSQIVNYIGHSEGTTIMFAALARRDPTILQYLNKFIALAPVAFVQDSKSPLVQIGGWLQGGTLLKDYDSLLKRKKFGWESDSSRYLKEDICSVDLKACVIKLRLISDINTSVDNTKRFPIFEGHFPAGTSLQNMVYWQQMFDNKQNFVMYDFGKAKNLQIYGTSKPPIYDLSRIEEPVYMFAGHYDELAPPKDTGYLRDQLTGSSYIYYELYPLGHSSFVFGKDVASYMQKVLNILKS